MPRYLAAALALLVSLLAPTHALAQSAPELMSRAKIVHVVGEISRNSQYGFETEMLATSHLPGDRVVIIDSPGGEVMAGQAMIASLEREKALGVKIVCLVVGNASSMAFNLLTHCSERLATLHSHMLVHKVAFDLLPYNERITANFLRFAAEELDRLDEPFRQANAKAMGISLHDYDLFSDKERIWRAPTLLEMGYLSGIVTE